MNVIPPYIHGILDYGTVVFFLLAPTLFPNILFGGAATVCYVLAAVHLSMTLLTDFPLGMAEVIALGVHGTVELIVSLALVVLPWILAPAFEVQGAQWFFTIVGVVIFAVWVLSDYSMPRASSKTSPRPKEQRVAGDTPPGDTPLSGNATGGNATGGNAPSGNAPSGDRLGNDASDAENPDAGTSSPSSQNV